MSTMISSLTDAIETAIKDHYESKLLKLYNDLCDELDKRWEEGRAEVRREIKLDASVLTMEVLRDAKINGISVEFKL